MFLSNPTPTPKQKLIINNKKAKRKEERRETAFVLGVLVEVLLIELALLLTQTFILTS